MCFDNWVGWGEEKRFLGMRMRFRGRNKDWRDRQREPQKEKKKNLKRENSFRRALLLASQF